MTTEKRTVGQNERSKILLRKEIWEIMRFLERIQNLTNGAFYHSSTYFHNSKKKHFIRIFIGKYAHKWKRIKSSDEVSIGLENFVEWFSKFGNILGNSMFSELKESDINCSRSLFCLCSG